MKSNIFFKKKYVYGCFVYLYVYALLVCLMPTEARGVIESPGSRVMDSYELLCSVWESNSGS